MPTLEAQLAGLITRIGTEFKSVRGALAAKPDARARTTATITSTAMSTNQQQQTTIALAAGYRLLKIATDRPARLRVYPDATYRAADASRAIGTALSGDHGVLLDYVTSAAVLSAQLSPQVDGYTVDGTTAVPITITNLDGATATVTVTLTWIRTE